MRRTALVVTTATLCFCSAASPASADVGGTLCSLVGWVSGVASKVCTVAQHAGGVLSAGKKLAGGNIGGAIGALTGGGATKAVARAAGLAAVATAVVAGAQYALEQTGKLVGSTTTPRLGTTWFSTYYWRMAAVSALLTLPFLCAAAVQALLRSDVTLLARSAFGYLPLGLLAVGIAAPLTGLLLAGSDEMSAIVSAAAGHADTGILGRAALVGLIAGGGRSLFVAFFVALFTVAAAVTLWLELLIREAAVYVVVLMLPLFFAAMVWPARRIWAIRAVELLVALILSKFAIVAVLSLGGAALGHTLLPGLQALLAGTTLVLLAAFSPWAMLRLLPLHELASAAVGGLRPLAGQPSVAADARAQTAADASEDVALESAASVLARMPRDRAHGGDDAAEVGAAAAARASAPEAEEPPDEQGGAGSANANGTSAGTGVMDEPREDAFGSTVRVGPLPPMFRADSRWRPIDLTLEGLRAEEPLVVQDAAVTDPSPAGGRSPDPEWSPEPGAALRAEPERLPEPEAALRAEPDPGPALPRPDPRDDQ